MMRRKNKKAVSLAEVMVSVIILALSVTGIIAVFYTARNYIARADKRSVATSLSHSNFRVLPRAIRSDVWNSGDLSIGTKALPDEDIDLYTYTGEYEVSRVNHPFTAGFEDYRQVDIKINYPD